MSENIAETLKDIVIDINKVKPRSKNARRGNVEVIRESLEVNGQYRPIVVNKKTGEVLAGNHTLKAAKALGWKKIAATYVDVNEESARKIVLIDNRATDLASYDNDELAKILKELAADDIAGTGYDASYLDNLINSLNYEGGSQEIDLDTVEDSLNQECPRCGFVFE